MNLNQIVNGLKEFKVSAFMNNPQNKYVIQNFVKSTMNTITYEGQKRIVIVNPEDERTVIKIGCSEDGIWDNACEYIMYSTIKNLYLNKTPISQTGEVLSDTDILLFPNCELVKEDPFLLKAERIETPETLEEYKQWKNTIASVKYPGKNLTDAFLWTEFLLTYQDPVSKQCVIKNDFDRGFEILSKISIHSDLGYESPLNKGVRRVNGVLRGVFLDLGSCLPIINDSQRPKCPKCGQTVGGTLHYYYAPIDNFNSIERGVDSIVEFKGIYVCDQPSCEYYGRHVLDSYQYKGYAPLDLRDSRVFDAFINDIRFNPAKFPSYITLFYFYTHIVSAPIGMDKEKYYVWLSNNVDKNFLSNNIAFNVSYENYVFKTIASIVNPAYITQAGNNMVSALINDANIRNLIMNGQLSYINFKNQFANALATYNIIGENITCKISAIAYLSHLVNGFKERGNTVTFYDLYDQDKNSFVSNLQVFVQVYGNNLELLYNHLHL